MNFDGGELIIIAEKSETFRERGSSRLNLEGERGPLKKERERESSAC